MGSKIMRAFEVTPLIRIANDAGDVCKALRKDEAGFNGFGEAYFSWIESGRVKAWKKHNQMTMNLIVAIGSVRFVFVCDHGYEVIEIGVDNYARITVQPGVWFGFKGVSNSASLVLNISNIAHSDDEVDRLQPSVFDYNW